MTRSTRARFNRWIPALLAALLPSAALADVGTIHEARACDITFHMHLSADAIQGVTVLWERSRAHGPNWFWKLSRTGLEYHLEPGDEATYTVSLPGPCDRRRQYAIWFRTNRPGVNPLFDLQYFPNGWATTPNIELGDIGRFFPWIMEVAEEQVEEPDPAPPEQPVDTPAPAEPVADPPIAGRVLYANDFRAVPEGDLPSDLDIRGGTVMVDGALGRPMLRMEDEGWFRVPLAAPLGDRFTIEFDYHQPGRLMRLLLAPVTAGVEGKPGVPRFRSSPHHHFVVSPESEGVGIGANMGAGSDLPSIASRNHKAFMEGPVPVRIEVDGTVARVFLAGEQTAVLSRVEIQRGDQLEFYYGGTRGGPAWIGNLEVIGADTEPPPAE